MTLQELVQQAASAHLDRVAVCFDECNGRPPVCHSYKTMLSAASELASFLQSHGDLQGIWEIGLFCQPGVNKFMSSYETLLNFDTVSVGHMDLALFRLQWENVEVNWLLSTRKEKSENGNGKSTLSSEDRSTDEEHMAVRQKPGLAYVLHTSGTTGMPKVVRVPHACILPNVQHFRLCVVQARVCVNACALCACLPEEASGLPLSLIHATPTLLKRFGSQLIKSAVLSASTSLRVLALGGEAFPSLAILRSWRAEGNKTVIFNIYGVTEVSSWATFYRIPEETLNSTLKCELSVPLGRPLLGTVVEVRDTNGFTIQDGTGQVFLGGKNRVCFLGDEMMVPLGTMRATGDFVTLKDGEMFFLGRKDSQIKRHGKRLHMKLVQQVAEELQQVDSCAVTWYNQETLILFIVPKDGLVKDCLFKELQKHLPDHAVPDEIVRIETLPLTPHGKVDVSELNRIYLDYQNSKPKNKLHGKEELWGKLQYLWKTILSLPEDTVTVPDESLFLSSGGDSFKATWLFNEIEKLIGTSIPGLLEAILSTSISEVYSHIIATVFTDEDLAFT
uniref:Carrier domain-containing protein n=1 Tax=Jaculus jaculus TaxID=51337 RepID=A0A8C5K1H0_JACJA